MERVAYFLIHITIYIYPGIFQISFIAIREKLAKIKIIPDDITLFKIGTALLRGCGRIFEKGFLTKVMATYYYKI